LISAFPCFRLHKPRYRVRVPIGYFSLAPSADSCDRNDIISDQEHDASVTTNDNGISEQCGVFRHGCELFISGYDRFGSAISRNATKVLIGNGRLSPAPEADLNLGYQWQLCGLGDAIAGGPPEGGRSSSITCSCGGCRVREFSLRGPQQARRAEMGPFMGCPERTSGSPSSRFRVPCFVQPPLPAIA
jgi:hypothetical protein